MDFKEKYEALVKEIKHYEQKHWGQLSDQVNKSANEDKVHPYLQGTFWEYNLCRNLLLYVEHLDKGQEECIKQLPPAQ